MVRAVGLTGAHLQALHGIRKLHTLDLSRSRVSARRLAALRAIKSLRVLVLDGWTQPKGAPPTIAFTPETIPPPSNYWHRVSMSVRAIPQLEVLSMRGSEVNETMFSDLLATQPFAKAWPNLRLLDLAKCQSITYETFAKARTKLPKTHVCHPVAHCSGQLRLQHPPYDPNSPHADRLLRATVEFVKERGLAIVAVDVQTNGRTGFVAADGSRGTTCKVGPKSRVLRQGRADYQWEIRLGQSINLFPATKLERVLLLPNDGANWIVTDGRTERLVERFLK